jgi:pimeloyl-ACP methyl ester carboxylesterase
MKPILVLIALAGLCLAAPKTETGELNGAQFRIDIPDRWNGGLILYCHGYNDTPVRYEGAKPNPLISIFTDQGYAVAQSGYAAGGWAIQEALEDTEALRRYFTAKYGQPKETYVTGHSMGGFLTMELIETFPNSYDGGLALCGPLGAASWFMMRRVFDMRVVFDYYFPGVLPSPVKVPADFSRTPQRVAEVLKALEDKPEQAAAMRRYSNIRTNKELAATIVFWTYILKDLQQRGGGNPFDNRNTIYDGTPDDNAVNSGVGRYKADARAADYIRHYYTPTGRLTRPLLAIHSTYDVLVPPWVTNQYSILAAEAGSSDWFVQQYVKHNGHCAILPDEIRRGFDQLREWKTIGKRPPAGENR